MTVRIFTEAEAFESFDIMLDDCEDEVTICGYTYSASEAFKRVDPIAYRQAALDWFDSMAEDGEYFVEGYTDSEVQ
jgi:hypothetical protein